MDRLTLNIREGTTDRILRNSREFISFKCLGRSWTETGRLQTLTTNTLGWPIPVYQEKSGSERYIERKHVERIFDFDLLIVSSEGLQRPPLVPDGTSDARYMTSMRLKLLADNLWTAEEKAVRGKQIRRGKRIINPTLQLPVDPDGPALFKVEEDRVNIVCDKNMINCLLRHCKHLRPRGTESTAAQRKRLVAREKGICLHCGELILAGEKVDVDHLQGIAKFIDLVLKGKLSIAQAAELWWSDSNIRAIHTPCNQEKSHSTQKRKRAAK